MCVLTCGTSGDSSTHPTAHSPQPTAPSSFHQYLHQLANPVELPLAFSLHLYPIYTYTHLPHAPTSNIVPCGITDVSKNTVAAMDHFLPGIAMEQVAPPPPSYLLIIKTYTMPYIYTLELNSLPSSSSLITPLQ